MKLVLFPAVDDARLARICEAAGELTVINAANLASALDQIADADAFFGKLTPQLLTRAQKLRWVQTPTASLEHYLFPELVAHPCQLTNMRGLFSDVVADHVLGFILMIARNLHRYLRNQQQHRWAPIGGEAERQTNAVGPGTVSEIDRIHLHLADCTLGVVGMGSIGQEICRRASAFGMTIRGVDVQPRSLPGILDECWPLQRLPDLLATSDFVCIAAPQTPETVHLFGSQQFQQMQRTAWLINVGRGPIVELTALTEALQSGVIAGAALDVFETEPLPPESLLWNMENVLITPHVAAASPKIAERHLNVLLENIRRFSSGEPLINVADKRKWY